LNPRRLTEQLVEEAKVIQQLKHNHIVKVVKMYVQKDQFSVVMLPVAEIDLGKNLELVNSTEFEPKRDAARFRMSRWPGCLIHALDYLHEMHVNH
jgi:serine/threonine protein kinase